MSWPKERTCVLVVVGLLIHGSQLADSAKEVEAYSSAYACLSTDNAAVIKCDSNEKISIRSVYYGVSPEGCTRWPTKTNCLQKSPTVTSIAEQECNGKTSCEVQVMSLKALDQTNEVIPVKNHCGIDNQLYPVLNVNYMVVQYQCQEFEFCKAINHTVNSLLMQTTNYPELSVTNPTCSCTFTSENENVYLKAYVYCNNSVTFVTEEMVPNLDSIEDRLKKVEKRYFCTNQSYPNYITVGNRSVSIKLKVDARNSSEYSSYSMRFFSTVLSQANGGTLIRKQGAAIHVSCDTGSLYLPATVQMILYITVPIVFVIIVAIVVACCVYSRIKRRRKNRRRRNNYSFQDPYSKAATLLQESSPTDPPGLEPSDVSTPMSTRKKPDGKVDSGSGSDEDILDAARKIHQQNVERKEFELIKRHLYYKNPNIQVPRTYSPFLALNQIYQGGDEPRRICDERRCKSITNLQVPPSALPPDLQPRRSLKASKSASNSRSSLRSLKRRAPQPPGFLGDSRDSPSRRGSQTSRTGGSRTELVFVPAHYEERVVNDSHDEEDPDLTFDDPRRRSDKRRDSAPTRSSIRNKPTTSDSPQSNRPNSLKLKSQKKTRKQPQYQNKYITQPTRYKNGSAFSRLKKKDSEVSPEGASNEVFMPHRGKYSDDSSDSSEHDVEVFPDVNVVGADNGDEDELPII